MTKHSMTCSAVPLQSPSRPLRKTVAVFFVACAVCVVVGVLVGQPMFPATASLARSIAAPTKPSFEERYVARITDEIHLALILQAVCPELVPDWLESQVADDTTELQGALRSNVLADDALLMIKAYYQRNGIAIQPEINTICEGGQREFKENIISKRLSKFDHYIAARKDADLDALHNREDFQKLVADLEAKTDKSEPTKNESEVKNQESATTPQ